MAPNDYRDSDLGIAVAAIGVVLSPQVRLLVRNGAVAALAADLSAGSVVARGTRNLQEAAKQVTTMGTEDATARA